MQQKLLADGHGAQTKLGDVEWVQQFGLRGYAVVRECLDAVTVAAFVEQMSLLLEQDAVKSNDGGSSRAAIDLAKPETWPHGGSRRVLELSPAARRACAGADAGGRSAGAGGDGGDRDGPWLEHWASLAQRDGKLARALDELLGEDCWELPFNERCAPAAPAAAAPASSAEERQPGVKNGGGGDDGPRRFDPLHWYCPIVFPELPDGDATGGAAGSATVGPTGGGCAAAGDAAPAQQQQQQQQQQGCSAREQRKAARRAEREERAEQKRKLQRQREAAAEAETAEAVAAAAALAGGLACGTAGGAATGAATSCTDRGAAPPLPPGRPLLFCSWQEDAGARYAEHGAGWQPVNRRRVRGKGWHLDWGPGFDTEGDGRRTLDGHPFQGVIVLLLLSDWAPGGGGTVVVPGSHRWVRERIAQAGEGGVPHAELNEWSKARVRAEAECGRLLLPVRGAVCDGDGFGDADAFSGGGGGGGGGAFVRQIAGRAGDVVLVHPWLIHSGSTNCGRAPRLMANGMARIKREAFEREGCRVLRL